MKFMWRVLSAAPPCASIGGASRERVEFEKRIVELGEAFTPGLGRSSSGSVAGPHETSKGAGTIDISKQLTSKLIASIYINFHQLLLERRSRVHYLYFQLAFGRL